jgi:hypothetical protein
MEPSTSWEVDSRSAVVTSYLHNLLLMHLAMNEKYAAHFIMQQQFRQLGL